MKTDGEVEMKKTDTTFDPTEDGINLEHRYGWWLLLTVALRSDR